MRALAVLSNLLVLFSFFGLPAIALGQEAVDVVPLADPTPLSKTLAILILAALVLLLSLNIFKRKRAEEALRASEERYRALFEGASEGILVAEIATMRFLYANATICRMLGYSAGELKQMAVSGIHREADLEWLMSEFLALSRGEKTLSYSIPCLRKDGTVMFADISTARIVIDGKQCNAGFFTDVTQKLEAQRALKEKTEDLDRFFSLSLDLLCIADVDGCFRHLNPAWEATLGYRVYQLEGRKFFDFVHPDDIEATQRAVESLSRGEKVFNFTNRYRRLDGSYCWLEWRSMPQGGLIYAAARDITGRKDAEKALEESEKRYRRIVENISDAIYMHDFHGSILDVNENACKMLGYSREELVGASLSKIGSEGRQELILERTNRLLSGISLLFEDEHVRKDGSRVPVEVSAKVISREGNGLIHGFVRDISERRRSELERQELENKLVQAQKMETVGRLAGGVAHDFNNILQGIFGYLGFVQKTLPQTDQRYSDLEQVKKAAQRAAALTNQLLAFSRRQILEVRIVDVNALISEFASMLERMIGEDIRLQIVLAPDVGLVKADASQIEQVLMNLAVNSRDAMSSGGTLVLETSNAVVEKDQLGFKSDIEPGEYVVIQVSDTGCGMDAHTQAMVFEPFFTTKEKGKGTGLGLSTVYGIVNQHRGDIRIYSEFGKGTIFRIYLPCIKALEGEISTSAPAQNEPDRGTETILVVEDDETVRRMACRMLQDHGYRVFEATDSLDAIRLAKELPSLDLLLTDVVMPVMNGRKVYEEVSKVQKRLKVLFISGYSEDVIAHHRVLEEGINFLEKPFTERKLMAKVREVLNG